MNDPIADDLISQQTLARIGSKRALISYYKKICMNKREKGYDKKYLFCLSIEIKADGQNNHPF